MSAPLLHSSFLCAVESFDTRAWQAWEWGSGASTRWLAALVQELWSVEHDPTWYAKTMVWAATRPRVHLILSQDRANYAAEIDFIKDRSLDLVLIDGLEQLREACTLHAIYKLKAGGVLVLDDIDRDWYGKTLAMLDAIATHRVEYPWSAGVDTPVSSHRRLGAWWL